MPFAANNFTLSSFGGGDCDRDAAELAVMPSMMLERSAIGKTKLRTSASDSGFHSRFAFASPSDELPREHQGYQYYSTIARRPCFAQKKANNAAELNDGYATVDKDHTKSKQTMVTSLALGVSDSHDDKSPRYSTPRLAISAFDDVQQQQASSLNIEQRQLEPNAGERMSHTNGASHHSNAVYPCCTLKSGEYYANKLWVDDGSGNVNVKNQNGDNVLYHTSLVKPSQ